MLRELWSVLAGCIAGFAIGAVFQLVSQGGNWDLNIFLAGSLGSLIGAPSAFIADRVLLAEIPIANIMRRLPMLFLAAILGFVVTLPLFPLSLFAAPLALMACAFVVRLRWERANAHPQL